MKHKPKNQKLIVEKKSTIPNVIFDSSNGGVAQRIEQRFSKPKVESSNLSFPTSLTPK